MGKLWIMLILVLLGSQADCLHFERVGNKHTTVQSELQALRAQQLGFENQVTSLISNITNLDSKVKSAAKVSDKVSLLENAIISERDTVFSLSNSLIPPFNLSKNACQELTNEQKINLLDQVSAAKLQIDKIKTLAAGIPPCAELKMISSDIQKQSALIESVEKAIYTKCDASIVLSPTIFQSNIYATNWILGNQTIDDLIEEYYQRSIQYDNITNCPLENPFFDGNSCINCHEPEPIFNILTRNCEACPFDTQLNTGLRICQQIPHYSDYSKATTYSLDGASSLPTPDPKLTPCPSRTPFWNGKCVSCRSGRWWSVKDNVCKSCPAGNAFDSNLKTCVIPSGKPFLTVLQGTQWVTIPGTFTQVLSDRAALLSSNSTDIQYCSDDSPYFDGFQCVNCDQQFDLQTKKCSSPPANNSYDDNIHSYVPTQANKETNSKAGNVISPNKPLTNTSVPDCDISTPYFDGIACISCPSPFILFDVNTKKCGACESDQSYNNNTLKCEKRPKVLISTNFNKLMATSTKSVDAYKQQLLAKVKDSKDSVVDKCNDTNQYSNFTACFACGTNELFNIQAKTCGICNGTMNLTTSVCIPQKSLLINFNTTPNLLLSGNKTLQDYAKEQAQIKGPTQNCPTAQPYSVFGQSCIACTNSTPYFDLEQKKCAACPINYFYVNKTLTCVAGQFVTNVKALTKYIEVDNYTITNIKKQNAEIAKTKPIIECNASQPFFDGLNCRSCPAETFINLKNASCTSAVVVANVQVLRELPNVFEQDNYTIDALQAAIKKIQSPIGPCDESKPALNGTTCYSCPDDKFYKLKTNECVSSVPSSNIYALKTLKNVKETGNFTLASIEKQIKETQLPPDPCNETAPLYNGTACVYCDEYSLYDLKNLSCILPQLYTNTAALKKLKFIELDNYTLANIDIASSKIPLPKKPCDEKTPFFTSKGCISCPNNSYYNLKTLQCTNAIPVTNVNAIKAANNFLEVDNYTLANISKQIAASTLPTSVCNVATPLFNGNACLSCNNSLYNLKTSTCVNCSIQDHYDNKTNKCTPKPHYYPNFGNNDWVVNDAEGIQRLINLTVARKNLTEPVPCPIATPFFNNNTLDCQACPVNHFFNYDQLVCVVCNNKQSVDPNIHVCSEKKPEGVLRTSLNSSNLIYNGISIAELQEKSNATKAKYPNIADCPPEKPYFDGYACITCLSWVPYFNVDTLICQDCGTNGAEYSKEMHDCVKEEEVVNTAPNPAKMYSSIF